MARRNRSRQGTVVIKGFSGKAARNEVIALLLASGEADSRETLERRLGMMPFVLRTGVPENEGHEIAGYLRSLGAEALFVPTDQAHGGKGSRLWLGLRLTLLAPLLLLTLGYAWHAYGGRPLPVISPVVSTIVATVVRSVENLAGFFSDPGVTPVKAHPSGSSGVQAARQPSDIGFVPLGVTLTAPAAATPGELRRAVALQFAPRPDRRFVMAYDALARMYGRAVERTMALTAGSPLWNGERLVVFLKNESQGIDKLEVVLPSTMQEGLAGLEQWLDLLSSAAGPIVVGDASLTGERLREVEELLLSLELTSMAQGLAMLEGQRAEHGMSAGLCRLAAFGYGLMAYPLYPDYMGHGDALAAQGLALLALARKLDPTLDLTREQGLLALVMGRSAEAVQVLGEEANQGDPARSALLAFAAGDVAELERIWNHTQSLLPGILLARARMAQSRWDESGQIAVRLLQNRPPSLSLLALGNQCGKLNMTKVMTQLYIALAKAVAELDGFADLDAEALIEEKTRRLKEAGEVNEAELMAAFEKGIVSWSPLSGAAAEGVFIDNSRLRLFLRGHADNAVWQRFNLLFNQWSVLKMALAFAQDVDTTSSGSTLSRIMLARINNATGKREEAAKIAGPLLDDTGLSVLMAGQVKQVLADAVIAGAAPAVLAKHMDGRPEGLRDLGDLCKEACLLDQAKVLQERALALDPRQPYAYTRLAVLEGDDSRLRQALQDQPENLQLLEDAIWYYTNRLTIEDHEFVLSLYDRAIELAPEDFALKRKRINRLLKMGRLAECRQYIEALLAGNPTGLDRNNLLSALTYVFIEQGEPEKVRAYAETQVKSAQAQAMVSTAQAFEAMGENEDAEEIFGMAMRRYPNSLGVLASLAGMYWRQGRDQDAATVLALLRPSAGSDRYWYGKTFCNALGEAPVDRITSAAVALREHGAPDYEILHLASRLAYMERHEAASRLLDLPIASGGDNQLSYRVQRYASSRHWKGEEEARQELYAGVEPRAMGPLSMFLFAEQEYVLVLQHDFSRELRDPRFTEFVHLQRLVSWLALGRKPAELAREFQEHYARDTGDYYHVIGRFLLGLSSEEHILPLMTGPKQVCEMGYYLGFAARLRGDFTAASEWYAVVLSTGLRNNGEYGWAKRELENWRSLGTSRRLPLPSAERPLLEQQYAQYYRLQLQEEFKLPAKGARVDLERLLTSGEKVDFRSPG